MKRMLAFFLLLVGLSGCRKQDVRTVTIQVPEMKNQACVERVIVALAIEIISDPRAEPDRQRIQAVLLSGDIQPDLRTRTVTVKYDSLRLSLKNLEFAIADIGFSANNTPANAEARKKLPPECL